MFPAVLVFWSPETAQPSLTPFSPEGMHFCIFFPDCSNPVKLVYVFNHDGKNRKKRVGKKQDASMHDARFVCL